MTALIFIPVYEIADIKEASEPIPQTDVSDVIIDIPESDKKDSDINDDIIKKDNENNENIEDSADNNDNVYKEEKIEYYIPPEIINDIPEGQTDFLLSNTDDYSFKIGEVKSELPFDVIVSVDPGSLSYINTVVARPSTYKINNIESCFYYIPVVNNQQLNFKVKFVIKDEFLDSRVTLIADSAFSPGFYNYINFVFDNSNRELTIDYFKALNNNKQIFIYRSKKQEAIIFRRVV
jgi:hypothetical protein